MSKITQHEIAKRLGISPATVSRALRGVGTTSPKTRHAVFTMARELGFTGLPNGALLDETRATGNRSDRTSGTVAVLAATDLNDVFNESNSVSHGYLAGLSQAANKFQTALLVRHLVSSERDRIKDPRKLPEIESQENLLGVVLMHAFPDEALRKLSRHYACATLITRAPATVNIDCVDTDTIQAIAEVVHLFQASGHERLCFVGINRNAAYSLSRYHAFQWQARAQRAISEPADPIEASNAISLRYEGDTDAAFEEMTDSVIATIEQHRVTGLVCANDWIAYNLADRLIDRGIRVPEDVSITGFDDLPPFGRCPRLTTIRPPFAAMGYSALEQVIARFEDPNRRPRIIQLRCDLIRGESIAPPNNA